MKILKLFFIFFIPLFGLTSCGVLGTSTQNVSNVNTNVDLSKNNFVVLGNVSGRASSWYLFGIGGLIGKNNLGKAYREMEKKANLTGTSRVIINVTYDTHLNWILIYARHKITASGTVIEFIDDNYKANVNLNRQTRSQEYFSNDDGYIMDMDNNRNTRTNTELADNNPTRLGKFVANLRQNTKTNTKVAENNPPERTASYYEERTVNNAVQRDYTPNVSTYKENTVAPCSVTYDNCTVKGATITMQWRASTQTGCGTPTRIYLQVKHPNKDTYETVQTLPGTAASASFDYTQWVSPGKYVYARIVLENEKGISNGVSMVYDVRDGKWY